jgi:chromate transporter
VSAVSVNHESLPEDSNPKSILRDAARAPSLLFLFKTFLKIGSVAFGGYLAIVAMIERELSERQKVVQHQTVLDAVALASTLPGPVAVNVVAYLGYSLRGLSGALVSIVGVILPSFFLLIGFTLLYQRFGEVPAVESIFKGFLPAVVAIVIGVAWRLGKQSIKKPLQWIVFVSVALVFSLLGGFLTALLCIVASGALGVLAFRKEMKASVKGDEAPGQAAHSIVPVLLLASSLTLATLALKFLAPPNMLRELWLSFSGMSLLMFGGGYVFIPMMKEVVVHQHHWLQTKEFADAIALGQITPGPVMISATFIGFYVASFWGALIATIGIFLPPALLITLCSNLHQRVANSPWVKAAYLGIRPCVVGLIINAAYVLARACDPSVVSALILVGALVATLKYKLDSIYVVPVAGLVGFLFL